MYMLYGYTPAWKNEVVLPVKVSYSVLQVPPPLTETYKFPRIVFSKES